MIEVSLSLRKSNSSSTRILYTTLNYLQPSAADADLGAGISITMPEFYS